MLRILTIFCFMLAALGCAPAIVSLPDPAVVASHPDDGPSVHLLWPNDMRPATSRRDGHNYSAYSPVGVPLPHHLYGDNNLRPSPMAAMHDNIAAALRERGVPLDGDNADFSARIHVLEHKGVKDVSDAQWVSTLTGGTAGTVGAFFYPLFATTTAHLRIQVLNQQGEQVAVRDVQQVVVRRKPKAFTWGIWSLYMRSVQREMFESAFEELYATVSTEAAEIIDEARRGDTLVAGVGAEDPLEHARQEDWGRLDSLDFRGNDGKSKSDEIAALKYGSTRFSVLTGHDTVKGDTIGRFQLPLDNFGYDVGLTNTLQLQIDITVLGLYNSFGVGLRYELWRREHRRLALQGRIGGVLAWETASADKPLTGGVRGGANLLYSSRPNDLTWFVRAGAGGIGLGNGLEQYGVADATILNAIVEPGLEYQVTPTMGLAFSLAFRASFQAGDPLDVASLPSLLPVPTIALGLR